MDRFYIWARDEDHALELAGHGADAEFDSVAEAREGFDPEFHAGRKLYKISVEQVDVLGSTIS